MKTMMQIEQFKGSGFITMIRSKLYELLLSPLPSDNLPLEVDRVSQFTAYFNNRMYILLMWIQRPKERSAESKLRLQFFLNDMEHHFVDPYVDRQTRHAFCWLKAYLKVYPIVGEKNRFVIAHQMVARVYKAVGIDLPWLLRGYQDE